MRLTSVVIGGLLALAGEFLTVEAANCVNVALKVIPSCAQSCFVNGAPSIGCGGLDFECQCQQEAALYAAIEGCVASGCPSASYQAVIDGASSVCNCATQGLEGGVGSMSVSGISGISGGSQIGSYSATSVTTTVNTSPTYKPTTATAAETTATTADTTAAPASTTAGITIQTSTPTYFATAYAVSAGSPLSSVPDVRLIGSIVAALALGSIAL